MSENNLEQSLLQLRGLAESLATARAPEQQLRPLGEALREVLAASTHQLRLACDQLELVGTNELLQALSELGEPWQRWEDLLPRVERFEQRLAAFLEGLPAESGDSSVPISLPEDSLRELELAVLCLESHLHSCERDPLQKALQAVEAAERSLLAALEA